jgi:uncharacterized protein YlxP (DUF503 family)
MLVGVCQIELFMSQSDSLKAKRFVLSSVKTRLRNKFNISIAETGYNDKWQRAVIGIAVVSNERKLIDQIIAAILNWIEQDGRAEVVEHVLEIY